MIVRESVADINGRRVIGTTKSHQQRTISLPPTVLAALTERIRELPSDPHAFVFADSTGGALDYKNFIRHAWRPATTAAGLPGVTPHALRASCASWVVDAGGSVMDAGARLGHAKGTVTTRHYARAVSGRDADVADRLEVHLAA